MKTLGNLVLAGSLALSSGCITDKGQCQARVHQIYVDGDFPEERKGQLCSKIADEKSQEECWKITEPIREATMSACMTEKTGITTSCISIDDSRYYDCEVKK